MTSANHPDRDLENIARRLQFRKWLAVIVGFIVAIAASVAVNSIVSSNNHAAAVSARADCKTQYQSILNEPVKIRDNLIAQVDSLGAALNSQLGTALLNSQSGVKPTAADVAKYSATKTALDLRRDQLSRSIMMVNDEPTLNQASTKGFVWQGHRYSACPSV